MMNLFSLTSLWFPHHTSSEGIEPSVPDEVHMDGHVRPGATPYWSLQFLNHPGLC